ncbi:MAG: FAD-binding protein [Xanthobacteraceae bacterium]
MGDNFRPRDARDVESAVRWALGQGRPVEIVGRGSKRPIGRPAQADLILDLSGVAGVTLYEPEELVLTAKAGTPLAEIQSLLDDSGQQLAFEPLDVGHIFSTGGGEGSIGGVLAANLAGPRRVKAGSARDHFLGFSAVSGRGETFKSGGRVVKNVTGYDLCKLLAGSWGTLAVMTEVTVKVLPKPETETSVLIRGLDAPRAVTAMTRAMGSSCDVSGAAHLPRRVAAHLPEVAGHGAAVTLLRLEGFAVSVVHRTSRLEQLVREFGELTRLAERASQAAWRAVRDVAPLVRSDSGSERALWRMSVPPSHGAPLGESLARQIGAEILYDWAGGLLWISVEPNNDAGAAAIREAMAGAGHALLVRGPATVRAAIDVFEPQSAGLAALTRRVKRGFDPQGVLNPGRMWAGV